MKNNFKKLTYLSVAILFAVAVIFVSCSKDEDVVTDQINGDEVGNVDFSQRGGGCLFLSEGDYAQIPVAEMPVLKSIAAAYTLRCPSVGNQGNSGSCVGWGTAYAARCIKAGGSTYFSPNYVYNQIKVSTNCLSGSYVTTALNLIRTQGVCTWSYMPFSTNCNVAVTSAQKANAANYKISGYSTVSRTSSAIKAQIAAGRPVIVAGRVDSYFNNLGYNAVLTYVSGSGGGHCYCVVGYDDAKNAFKVLNSWGTSWSTSGYGWISYNIVGSLWSEAYIMN